MSPPGCELRLSALSAQTQRQFFAFLQGHGPVKPALVVPGPTATLWPTYLAGGLVLYLVLLVIGGSAYREWPWALAYAAAFAPVALGLAAMWLARQRAQRLPFARGMYLFPNMVVEARGQRCLLYELTDLKGAGLRHEAGGSAGVSYELQLVVGAYRMRLPTPGREAGQRALTMFQHQREVMMKAAAE